MNATPRLFLPLLMVFVAGCAQQKGSVKSDFSASSAELEQALAAKPHVSQPQAVEQALLPPLVVEMPKVDGKQSEPRFDLSVNNAPAAEVFLAIVSGTRYSMVVHPTIKEKLSVALKDVTVAEALDTLREMYGYEYKVQGSRILIQPIAPQTRLFQINYLLSQRKGKSDIRVNSGSVSDSAGQQQSGAVTAGTVPAVNTPTLVSSRIETKTETDFWSDLVAAVRAVIGNEPGRNVVANPQSGIIMVRALPSELRAVNDFLRTMQGVVARQVMLEAKIISVQLKDEFATGVNWAAFSGGNARLSGGIVSPGTTLQTNGQLRAFTDRSPDGNITPSSDITAFPGTSLAAGVGTVGTLFGLAFQTSNFAALIGFLETQGTLQVLSNPRIATLNNQMAVLKVGTDAFHVTNVTTNQTTTTGGAIQNSPTINTQPFFSGVALDVTPQIDDNNQIILHVHPSVSNVIDKTTDLDLGSSGTFRLPLVSSEIEEADAIVRVSDGSIAAIGGLMLHNSSNDKSQVPGAGDIPVAGNLFKNTNKKTSKSELVILLKPTIIRSDDNWRDDLRDTQKRVQALEHQDLSGIRSWTDTAGSNNGK